MANTTAHSKEVSWYLPGPPQLPGNIKTLLQNWSGINPANNGIEKHVENVVSRAQNPCVGRLYILDGRRCRLCTDSYSASASKHGMSISILAVGGYRFLTLGLTTHPSFNDLVSLLKSSSPGRSTAPQPLFMDLGCCVGQDLRSLAYAGVPGSRLVGVDLEPDFVNIGYELFRDREKLGSQFLIGDAMSLEASAPHVLAPLLGRVEVIWASAFFHLWHLPGQMNLCRKILMLLRDGPRVKILGRHVGSRIPCEIKHVTNKCGLMYRHNPESFKKMWAEVLGHVGKLDESSPIRSRDGESWTVNAWFEEDKSMDVQQKPVEDWLTKVSTESSGSDISNPQGINQTPDSKPLFLIWEVERIG